MAKKTKNLEERIEKALDSIRPYLEADGGDVKIIDISADMTLRLEFLGNCVSCPMSNMTLKAGVEEAVLNAAPEIQKVIALNLPDESRSSMVT